ncbi:glycosyltransferase family 4 protein [Tumebacillus permanentifrigoris]|uniref:Glycosyltransferase involved in cell wall biosynthesis n=1 Tax=Tumebacillus permanentifrigoris TaxID=378543 RepID=A0A316D8Z4_9BACL|nr:glycosyltransferase family 4 protein [Tumebacillus permanentifrigoris]PWK11290.1 glycosyltransferase involved in cell wall biosynthesis [Tumebacillus permanentifrigoris]
MRTYQVLQVLRPMQGGMRRHVLDLITGLLEAGHRVTAACPPETAFFRELSSLVPTLAFPLDDRMNPIHDLKAMRHLQNILRRERFDIVHLHGAKAGYVGRFAVRRIEPRPAVLYTVHNHVLPRQAILKKALNALERRLAADTDRVITVSDSLRREVCHQHGVEEHRSVTIRNGIQGPPPLTRRYARAVLGAEEESRIVIACIGRMVEEKGIDVLLEAFTILLSRGFDAELVLIGDGPLLSDYQNRAGKIGLARVRFLGEVPNAAQLLPGVDIVAVPSRQEGLGLVAIEAMLAGRPVVASDVGGLPEVVLHGETGLLVPPADPVLVASALCYLIERGDVRERMGRLGSLRAHEHFSRHGMMRSVLREYDEVMASRQGVIV